jgi:hypothetical protein
MGGQIMAMAGPGVIGMGVRDHGPLDRPPRVDVKAAGRAVQALGPLDDEVVCHTPVMIGK